MRVGSSRCAMKRFRPIKVAFLLSVVLPVLSFFLHRQRRVRSHSISRRSGLPSPRFFPRIVRLSARRSFRPAFTSISNRFPVRMRPIFSPISLFRSARFRGMKMFWRSLVVTLVGRAQGNSISLRKQSFSTAFLSALALPVRHRAKILMAHYSRVPGLTSILLPCPITEASR